jgi:general secretion pathway protein G
VKKRTRIFLTVFLLLLVMGWGVNQWIILPRIKRKYRETILKQNLHDMRKAIDQFADDRRGLPQALDDLVNQGYIREIPIDPITHKKDWAVEFGEAPPDFVGGQGIVDVSSAAAGAGADGRLYGDY